MIVQAKFKVHSVTDFGPGAGKAVVLNAVTGERPENKDFWKYTPNGKIEMSINGPAADVFKPQEEILIEFHIPEKE